MRYSAEKNIPDGAPILSGAILSEMSLPPLLLIALGPLGSQSARRRDPPDQAVFFEASPREGLHICLDIWFLNFLCRAT